MRKRSAKKYRCVLGIAPSTRGFGFAVIAGSEILVDWGVKTVSGDKNACCLTKVQELIAHYEPDLIVLQDYEAKDSRRSQRIRKLGKQLADFAVSKKIYLAQYSREQMQQAFLSGGTGTKHDIAQVLANRFSDELGFRLPPKRRPWMNEDYRMDMFDATALACMPELHRRSQCAK